MAQCKLLKGAHPRSRAIKNLLPRLAVLLVANYAMDVPPAVVLGGLAAGLSVSILAAPRVVGTETEFALYGDKRDALRRKGKGRALAVSLSKNIKREPARVPPPVCFALALLLVPTLRIGLLQLVPALATCAAYQAGTILNKHFGHTGAWQKSGAAALFAHAQENMHRAMMTCATMEITTLPVVLAELFTPRRSFARAFALANLLRRRYKCPDNTVFRIKYTYYDAGYYHRQFWHMLDEKTAPAIARVPPLAALVETAKARLAGTSPPRKPKAT